MLYIGPPALKEIHDHFGANSLLYAGTEDLSLHDAWKSSVNPFWMSWLISKLDVCLDSNKMRPITDVILSAFRRYRYLAVEKEVPDWLEFISSPAAAPMLHSLDKLESDIASLTRAEEFCMVKTLVGVLADLLASELTGPGHLVFQLVNKAVLLLGAVDGKEAADSLRQAMEQLGTFYSFIRPQHPAFDSLISSINEAVCQRIRGAVNYELLGYCAYVLHTDTVSTVPSAVPEALPSDS